MLTDRFDHGIGVKIASMPKLVDSLVAKPILVNYIDIDKPEDIELLKNKSFMWYTNAELDGVARCSCGASQRYLGTICRKCGSEVINPIEEKPTAQLWLYVPDRIAPILTCQAFRKLQLLMEFKSGKDGGNASMDVLVWLINPNYREPKTKSRIVGFTASFYAEFPKYKRGINDFYKYFDAIIAFMMEYTKVTKKVSVPWQNMYKYIQVNRETIFTRWLGFPSRIIFAVENVSYGTFADPSFELVMDALYTASGIEVPKYNGGDRDIEIRIAKALINMSKFYTYAYKEIIGSKEGIARGHQYGTRTPYNARAIVTSIEGAHSSADEMHLGWPIAINMLQQYIYNRLIRNGLNPSQANSKLRLALHKYDKDIDDIFDDLIEEAKLLRTNVNLITGERLPGIPMTLHRNPTLVRLANQFLRVTKIFKNPKDPVVAMSPLAMYQPNTDLDGDGLNIRFMLDEYDRMICERYHPRTGVFSTNIPGRVSTAVQMPDEGCATISNFLKKSRKITGQVRG